MCSHNDKPPCHDVVVRAQPRSSPVVVGPAFICTVILSDHELTNTLNRPARATLSDVCLVFVRSQTNSKRCLFGCIVRRDHPWILDLIDPGGQNSSLARAQYPCANFVGNSSCSGCTANDINHTQFVRNFDQRGRTLV